MIKDDTREVLKAACQFESLESRVLMSGVQHQEHALAAPAVSAHALHAKSKAPAPTPTPAPVAPAAPSGLTATPLTFKSVQLNWIAGSGATDGFIVLRGTNGTQFTQIAKFAGAAITTYTDNTAASFHNYYYEVEGYKSTAISPASASATASTSLATVATFTASATGPNTVQLSWSVNEPLAAGYDVLGSKGGKAFMQLAQLPSITTGAYTVTGLSSDTTYAYEVEAYNGAKTSAASAPVSTTTPLIAPTGLTAAFHSSVINLTWSGNDPTATGYFVLRSIDGKTFTQFANVKGNAATTYSDTAVLSGHSYYYKVQAYAGNNMSAATAATTVSTPLTAPSGLAAAALSATSVHLAWTDNDVNAAGYYVLRSSDGVDFTQIASIAGATIATYTDYTAVSGQNYSYEIQAVAGTIVSSDCGPATATTPLATPTGLSALATSPTSITLAWSNVEPLATGFNILRSTNGGTFTQLTQIASTKTLTWIDSTASSDTAYAYEVQATGVNNQSALATAKSVTTPLIAVSGLTATLQTGVMDLAWTDNDSTANGYKILRSVNGAAFAPLTTIANATAASYADTTVLSGHAYNYEIQAYSGTNTSAFATAGPITLPLATPTALTAALAGAYVNLSWTDKDPAATGYDTLRSTDGINFTQLAQVTGAAASSYADTTVNAGQTYYYQVQAYNTTLTSAVSTAAHVTTPGGTVTNGASVTTRFGDELVITAAGASDAVSVTESNGTLTIVGDGQTFTDVAPAGGTFVYTRGGSDSITIAASVTSPLTIDAIDAAPTVITTSGTNVNAWIDSTDTLIGTATVHTVASFAGGVSKALAASLANPKDAGTTAAHNLSLFGAGPVAADVNQGEAGDCYFLSSLAAFANQDPQVLLNSAVDLGDGTYAVEFHNAQNQAVYVRVNNSFTTGGFGGFDYAHPGANDTIWAAVFEKAFCYFRTGANTYASINSGWMDEVYHDLGVASTDFTPSAYSSSTLFTLLSTDLADGEAVTLGTQNAPNLVSDHAYMLMSVSTVNGVNYYTVRNPWGVSGDSLENSQGIATLTYAQLIANFVGGTAATTG